MSLACFTSVNPGNWITIPSMPSRSKTGSLTPKASIRLRKISMARSAASEISCSLLPCILSRSTTRFICRPPWISNPSFKLVALCSLRSESDGKMPIIETPMSTITMRAIHFWKVTESLSLLKRLVLLVFPKKLGKLG